MKTGIYVEKNTKVIISKLNRNSLYTFYAPNWYFAGYPANLVEYLGNNIPILHTLGIGIKL